MSMFNDQPDGRAGPSMDAIRQVPRRLCEVVHDVTHTILVVCRRMTKRLHDASEKRKYLRRLRSRLRETAHQPSSKVTIVLNNSSVNGDKATQVTYTNGSKRTHDIAIHSRKQRSHIQRSCKRRRFVQEEADLCTSRLAYHCK